MVVKIFFEALPWLRHFFSFATLTPIFSKAMNEADVIKTM